MANAKAKLTKTYVDKIEPPEEGKIIVWDTEQTGFGVYVTSNNVRSWFINFRTGGGRDRRLVLGRCDRLTIDQARIEARSKLADVDRGHDPAQERREIRARMRMDELLERYIKEEMPRRKRASTIELHEGQIERCIKPAFTGMAVADIGREDVKSMHRKMTDTYLGLAIEGASNVAVVIDGDSVIIDPAVAEAHRPMPVRPVLTDTGEGPGEKAPGTEERSRGELEPHTSERKPTRLRLVA